MKVLKFGAIWCPGCLVMKPRWKELEQENPWLKTEYFEYDDNKEMVKKYHIDKNLPVFVFLDKNGNEIRRYQGEIEKDVLVKAITEDKDK